MGGSGGGASGTVSWPTYIQTIHGAWLDGGGTDHPITSLVDAMNAAIGNSPFTGAVAFDPDIYIGGMQTALDALNGIIAAMNHTTDFQAGVVTARAAFPKGTTTLDTAVLDTTTLDVEVLNDADISQDMSALDAILNDQLEIDLVKFKAGMLNIGAINSSAYALGEAHLRGMKNRSVASHGSGLRVELNKQVREGNIRHKLSFKQIEAGHKQKFQDITALYKRSFKDIDFKLYTMNEEIIRMAVGIILNQLTQNSQAYHNFSHLLTETYRVASVLKKEETEEQMAIDEADGKWDMEAFRYAGNLLAAPSGGVAQGADKKSRAVSAIGGVLSGAATGAAIGTAIEPGIGTAIGAIGGAVLGVGMGLAH